MPGQISSSPRTAGLPPCISFSTSYPELDAAAEAAVGLVIEISLIATFTQRFFGR
jgi:hypothetical protein